MNYGCMSCGAKYSIPDARLQKAGADGLRVRCSRCRAIMAVSSTMATATTSKTKTKPKDDVFARTGGVSPHAPSTALVTGVVRNPFADFATPDAASGAMAAGHGQQAISRNVTGIFMPMIASLDDDAAPVRTTTKASNSFYAAIEGRARGPYTSAEMLMLAHKGKIRASTLVWKPGCGGWKGLRHVVDFDVSFLLDAVRTRKRREREAESLAQRRLGIAPVRIERQTVRPTSGRRQAPALPFDAAFDFDDATALPQVGPHNELSSPFLWRAPAGPQRARRPLDRRWWTAAAVFVVVVAAGLLTAATVPLPF